MSADLELLQRAEALMRKRAESATPGPWTHGHEGQGGEVVRGVGGIRVARVYKSGWPHYAPDCENAEQIACWDPVVALAVADTVHQAAVDLWAHGPMCACVDGCIECDDNHWMPYARKALTLARTYLKES